MRTLAAAVIAVLLSALIYVGNFSWWLDAQVLGPDEFSESTVEALNMESSRDAIGSLIVVGLVDEFPLLIILESNLTSLFSDLLASPALAQVLSVVALEAHDRMVTGGESAVVVDLADHRELILRPIEAVVPRLSALVPDEWFTSVEVLEAGSFPDLSRQARWAGSVKFLSVVGAAVLAFILLRFVRPRGFGPALVGTAFLLAGFATAILVPGGRALALARSQNPSIDIIVANTYDQFTGHLKVSAFVFALIGVALIGVGIARWSAQPPDHW